LVYVRFIKVTFIYFTTPVPASVSC